MATSSKHWPGLWVEDVKLVLPADDCKGETSHDGPLRDCAPLAADALRRSTFCFAMFLTGASKVGAFVALLRSTWQRQPQHPELLIGSISEHQWLVPALDVIVATPEEALEYRDRVWVRSSSSLKALLIDTSVPGILPQAYKLASRFSGFESMLPPPSSSIIQWSRPCWYGPPKLVRASQEILSIISGTPETWDERAYVAGLRIFAWGVSKVAVQEWGDVPVLLPGIIRGSMSQTSPPLVLAPREKLDQISQLLLTTAAELGLSGFTVGRHDDARVLLDCPEDLVPPNQLERLVIIEADKLLESYAAWKIHSLSEMCINRPVGVQFSTRTRAVDELLRASTQPFSITKPPGVTMEGVFEFFTLVGDESEKLDRLCDVWRRMMPSSVRAVVLCSSSSRVVWVAEQMRSRGFSAWSLCEGEGEVDPNMYQDLKNPVLVTNVCRRNAEVDVINYDVPDSFGRYVERVGRERYGPWKVVVNLLTADQHRRLAESRTGMVQLPENCARLHRRLFSFFPDVIAAAT